MSLTTWIIIIVSVIAIVLAIYLVYYRDMDPSDVFTMFILGAILEGAIASSIESKFPKPIDVYRGKTSLKISYVDTIPQDTLVIWKEYKQ